MDRSWMNAHRTSHEYQMGVEGFIAFANVPNKDGKYFCPCVKCVNCIRKSVEDIRGDLIFYGINLRYTPLIFVLQFYGSKRRFDQESEIDTIRQHIAGYYLNHALDNDESD